MRYFWILILVCITINSYSQEFDYLLLKEKHYEDVFTGREYIIDIRSGSLILTRQYYTFLDSETNHEFFIDLDKKWDLYVDKVNFMKAIDDLTIDSGIYSRKNLQSFYYTRTFERYFSRNTKDTILIGKVDTAIINSLIKYSIGITNNRSDTIISKKIKKLSEDCNRNISVSKMLHYFFTTESTLHSKYQIQFIKNKEVLLQIESSGKSIYVIPRVIENKVIFDDKINNFWTSIIPESYPLYVADIEKSDYMRLEQFFSRLCEKDN